MAAGATKAKKKAKMSNTISQNTAEIDEQSRKKFTWLNRLKKTLLVQKDLILQTPGPNSRLPDFYQKEESKKEVTGMNVFNI